MSEPFCNHDVSKMVYKLRDHVDWQQMSRACYCCEKCLPKMRRWVSAKTGHVVEDMLREILPFASDQQRPKQ